mmetsp:Transcript_15746/g.32915  ORF Transcript_15746/g.32915 Transcript_15746/m.32915 type:complete len:440 (-) Transcript_15746:120-1439(-)
MTPQIKVSSRRNSHQFLNPKRKLKRNIRASPSIMRQAIPFVNIIPHKLIFQPHAQQKFPRILNPLLVKGLPHIIPRRNEILDLHLLEFPRTENKISRSNFVPKRLPDLSNSKRQFGATGPQNIFVVDENALCRLGTEIGHRRGILHGPHIGLEHEIEVPRHGQGGFVTSRGGNLSHLLFRDLGQIFEFKRFDRRSLLIRFLEHFLRLRLGRLDHVLVVRLEDADVPHRGTAFLEHHRSAEELIGAIPQFGLLAIHHGIAESVQVPRALPRGGVVHDGAVDAHDVFAALHEVPPEGVFDVAFEFRSEGAVVEESGEAIVDLRGREDDAATFAEGDDVFHFEIVVGTFVFNGFGSSDGVFGGFFVGRGFGGLFGGFGGGEDGGRGGDEGGAAAGGDAAESETEGPVDGEEHGQGHGAVVTHSCLSEKQGWCYLMRRWYCEG